jgi:broad specificity phosphatase PhoE
MRIYLLRHGETEWNVDGRIQGQLDVPLSDRGIRQARGWRPYFDRIELAGVYSSALSRAMDTAMLATGRPPCIIPELNERCFGELQGKVWPRQIETVLDFSPPGGETREQLENRVREAFNQIVSSHNRSAEVLIVCHGGSSRVILAHAGAPPTLLGNAALALLSVDNGQWSVQFGDGEFAQ